MDFGPYAAVDCAPGYAICVHVFVARLYTPPTVVALLNVTVAVMYCSRIPVGSVEVAPGKTLVGALNGVTPKLRARNALVKDDDAVGGTADAEQPASSTSVAATATVRIKKL